MSLLPQITPKYIRETDNLMSRVTEEQHQLENQKKWMMLNVMKTRRALGGEVSLSKISNVTSP